VNLRRLQLFHSRYSLGMEIAAAIRRAIICLLVNAGIAYLVIRYFNGVIAFAVIIFLAYRLFDRCVRMLGPLVGPPEPTVTGGTRVEERRTLRRAGMLGKRL
jgi:hypothetical protein